MNSATNSVAALEARYVVLKIEDIKGIFTRGEVAMMARLSAKVNEYRKGRGKEELSGIFVESDWPEYEPTKAAVLARTEGKAALRDATLEQQQKRIDVLEACIRSMVEDVDAAGRLVRDRIAYANGRPRMPEERVEPFHVPV